MALAMGRVETSPFEQGEIAELKGSIIASLASDGLKLGDEPGTEKTSQSTSGFWDYSSPRPMILRSV